MYWNLGCDCFLKLLPIRVSVLNTFSLISLLYDIKNTSSSCVCVCTQGVLSQWPERDDCVQPGNDLRSHVDEVTGRDGGRHDEHQVSEHCGGDYHWKPPQGALTNTHAFTYIHKCTHTHLTDMYSACSCQIFGEAPDLSVPLPQAPSSRSTPRRSKAICLSSGKRKARLYPPALCLADNDSESFCNL